MECSRSIATVRAQLGDAAFAAAWAEGQALPLEQAVAYALDPATLPEPAPDMPPTNTRAVQPPD
jgi:hypothetical protein